jgi:hypothetical protein
VPAGLDCPAVAGVEGLDRVRAADDPADLHVVEPVAESLRDADWAYPRQWRLRIAFWVGVLGRCSGSVDLREVERGGCQVQFVGRVVQTAAGEPVNDFLEVADAGLDRCATPLV